MGNLVRFKGRVKFATRLNEPGNSPKSNWFNYFCEGKGVLEIEASDVSPSEVESLFLAAKRGLTK